MTPVGSAIEQPVVRIPRRNCSPLGWDGVRLNGPWGAYPTSECAIERPVVRIPRVLVRCVSHVVERNVQELGVLAHLGHVNLPTNTSRNILRVGICPDFASSSTRAPRCAYVRMSAQSRIRPHWGGVVRLPHLCVPGRPVRLAETDQQFLHPHAGHGITRQHHSSLQCNGSSPNPIKLGRVEVAIFPISLA